MKVDISRAFCHVKLDTRECDLLGLCHIDWYVNTCLPFGYRHRSALLQCLSDAVCHIMCQHGFDLVNYIDDMLGYVVRLMPLLTHCICYFNIAHLEKLNILAALKAWHLQRANKNSQLPVIMRQWCMFETQKGTGTRP